MAGLGRYVQGGRKASSLAWRRCSFHCHNIYGETRMKTFRKGQRIVSSAKRLKLLISCLYILPVFLGPVSWTVLESMT
jgi:hypothetical protein